MDFNWTSLFGLIPMLWGGQPADVDSTPKGLLEAIYHLSPATGQKQFAPKDIYSDHLLTLFMQHEIDNQVTVVSSATHPPPVELIPFDPLTLGSSPHNVVIAEPDVRDQQATAIVSFEGSDGPVQLSVFFVEQSEGWRIDDVAAFNGKTGSWLLSRLLKDDTSGAD